MHSKIYFGILFFIFSYLPSFGQVVYISDAKKIYKAEINSFYLKDIVGNLTLDSVLRNNKNWQKSKTENLNFGFQNKPYWIKLDIATALPFSKEIVFFIENSNMNEIDLYLLDSNYNLLKHKSTGNLRPFSTREFNHRYFAINLPIENDKLYHIYIRYKSEDVMAFQSGISSLEAYFEYHTKLQLIEGFFFGSLLLLAIYNLFIYVFSKEISFLYYVLYITCTFLFQFEYGGWFNQYVTKDFPSFSSRLGLIFTGIACTTSIIFLESYIPVKYRSKSNQLIANIIKILGASELLFAYFVPLLWNFIFIISFSVFLVLPYINLTNYLAYKQGLAKLRFLIWGWGIITFGVLMLCLAASGILPFIFITKYSIQVGTIVEGLLLSFALADKITVLRQEKQVAQRQMITQLQENEQLLQKLNMEQRRVFNAVLQGEENERKRISFELHDGLGQMLSLIKIQLSTLEQWSQEKGEAVSDSFKSLIAMVDEACNEIRNISNNLMPHSVSDFGLIKALDEFVIKIKKTKQINIHFEKVNIKSDPDKKISNTIFRIIQETTSNCIKYSKALNLYIQLIEEEKEYILMIEDDGVGFNFENIKSNSQKGMGIRNIISRVEVMNGTFNLDTKEGRGTVYHITLSKILEKKQKK